MRSLVTSRQSFRRPRRTNNNRLTPQLHRLEDRAMPSANLDVYNRGDFYRVNNAEIALDRRTDLLTIKVDNVIGVAAIHQLTAVGGPLQGFQVLRKLEADEWVLQSPPSTATGPNIALTDDSDPRLTLAANVEGVQWIAPVLFNPETASWMAVTDEVIVALADGVDGASFMDGDRRFASYRPLAGTPDQFVVTLAGQSGVATLAVSDELHDDPRVKWAQPNFWQNYQRFFTPNDPIYSSQWHLNQASDVDVDAPQAWDLSKGSGITIAIVDDGIEITHPDLVGNIFVNPGEIAGNGKDDDGNGWIDDVNGWDFTANDNAPGPDSSADEHGTSTAGVAAGVGNNSLGTTGAAFQAKILPARVFAGAAGTSDANFASAIYYSAGRTFNGLGQWNAANITSNSWGGGSAAQVLTDAFTWASNSAKSGQGVASFIATGNGGTASVSYPASLSGTNTGVIAVGASTNTDVRSSYSQYGPQVDVLAPSNGGSLGIVTTDRTGSNGYNSSSDYTIGGEFGGTSSATPLAAGIGALALSLNPSLTANQLRGLLRNTTDYIGTTSYSDNLGFTNQYGYGRVNAFTAVSGVGKPEIQVLNGITNLVDGSGLVDFGTLTVGSSSTVLLRIRNQGTLPLNLSNLSVPAPFSIATNFGDTSLAVGEITTMVVRFSPTTGGLQSQILTFNTNDADEALFELVVRGTGSNPSISGVFYDDWNQDGIRMPSDDGVSGGVAYLDLNNNGVYDSFPPVSSTNVPQTIPNPGTISSTLNIAGFVGSVTDVNVTINVLHGRDQDLDIYLTGPTGVKVELTTDNGGTGDNYTNTTFDDQAAIAITAGAAPFTGTFRPEGLLSTLNGLNPNGTWTLSVTDDSSNGTAGGSLQSWSIAFKNSTEEPTAMADANGFYSFSNLAIGNYTVGRVVPTGYTATGVSSYAVSLPSTSATATNRDFGLVQQNAIYGQAFRDVNVNGLFDGADVPLDGRTVYLDTNNNGTRDYLSFTNSTVVSIPDNNATGASSNIAISNMSEVSGVRVKVNLTHTYDGDLSLMLISPQGTIIPLATQRGGSGQNFVNTVFDDAAAISIASGTAPFTGSFRPESPLSALNGEKANGTWTLKVVDSFNVDTGTINNWTLELQESSFITDVDGVYRLGNLTAGVQRVREIVPGGWTETSPVGGVHQVTVVAGQTYSGRDFGSNDNTTPPLTVTAEQAAGQLDPTNGATINFTVVFSATVSDFDANDVTIGGSAGAVTAIVNGSGTTYNIAVSGMTQSGTVTVSIPAGAATSGTQSSLASTSLDNSVNYDAKAPTSSIGALPNIVIANSNNYTFDVTFSDETAVSVASIGSGVVRVTGPNGFDVAANLILIDNATDGTPRVATFSAAAPPGGWTATRNGVYSIGLQAGSVADTIGNTMTATTLGSFNVAIAPTVASFQINDGAAQRSMVKSFTIAFSDVVTLPALAVDAFSLVRTGPTGPTGAVDLAIDTATLSTATQTIAKITFSGVLTEVGSLVDGRYDFAVMGNQVTVGGVFLDGDGNGSAGGNFAVNQLHRLFGDSDGNATVNTLDFAAFRGVFGLPGPTSIFDANDDGVTNASDFGQFRARFGISI